LADRLNPKGRFGLYRQLNDHFAPRLPHHRIFVLSWLVSIGG